MTREEAIKILELMRYSYTNVVDGALDMAISTLREQEERSKGCSSCDGGFGDNTLEFAKIGYKFCPYCGRRLEEI